MNCEYNAQQMRPDFQYDLAHYSCIALSAAAIYNVHNVSKVDMCMDVQNVEIL